MLKLLTDEKISDALRYSEGDVFALRAAAGIKVYGTDMRSIRSWYGENKNGEINCIMSITGETLWAAFSEDADFQSAYALARACGATELIFDARYSSHMRASENAERGDIMSIYSALNAARDVQEAATEQLGGVYAVIFEAGEGSFDRWYTETSHRIRHRIGRVFVHCTNSRIVSTASVIIENESAGLISEVATLSPYRRQGFAAQCVSAAVNSLYEKGKQAVLLSAGSQSSLFYSQLGFLQCGEWCKIIF